MKNTKHPQRKKKPHKNDCSTHWGKKPLPIENRLGYLVGDGGGHCLPLGKLCGIKLTQISGIYALWI